MDATVGKCTIGAGQFQRGYTARHSAQGCCQITVIRRTIQDKCGNSHLLCVENCFIDANILCDTNGWNIERPAYNIAQANLAGEVAAVVLRLPRTDLQRLVFNDGFRRILVLECGGKNEGLKR